ncbi:MAG: four-carbon acid sugar kinase family protein, partial [Planctomycetota bacterium]|nr:four-carbon acid sugar kinase family protein [Planctomycetota bacterium]
MFIIADDFSGCTDAQVQLLPFGLSAVSVLPGKGFAPFLGKHDCLILDNEARAGTPETAYNNTRQMVESVPLDGETFFKKIDSTF